jgi:hypothetical protein
MSMHPDVLVSVEDLLENSTLQVSDSVTMFTGLEGKIGLGHAALSEVTDFIAKTHSNRPRFTMTTAPDWIRSEESAWDTGKLEGF